MSIAESTSRHVTYVGYADKNSASDAAMLRLQMPAVTTPVQNENTA